MFESVLHMGLGHTDAFRLWQDTLGARDSVKIAAHLTPVQRQKRMSCRQIVGCHRRPGAGGQLFEYKPAQCWAGLTQRLYVPWPEFAAKLQAEDVLHIGR